MPVFVGPYVACNVGLVKKRERIRTCSNEKCRWYKPLFADTISSKRQVCSCGAKIERRLNKTIEFEIDCFELEAEIIQERLVLITDRFERFEGFMKKQKKHYWVSNTVEAPCLFFEKSREGSGPAVREMDEATIADELAKFADELAKFIELHEVESAVKAVKEATVADELAKFMELHEDDIDILRDIYGADHVSVEWGAICYPD